MAKKYMKRCLATLKIREMQIKTILRYYLTPARMSVIKKSTHNKCWREYREKGIGGGNVNCCSHYEKKDGNSLKN